ncbi:MAG TPA: hypothetical protein VFV08_07560 [Puia sp.]|nr:hypothetical protein [Puia sp.]
MKHSNSVLVVMLFTFSFANTYKKEKIPSTAIEKDSSQYLSEVIQFIQQIKQQELNNNFFILEDEPATLDYFDCLKELRTDTATFSKTELSVIEQEGKEPLIKIWTNSLIPKIKIISADTVRNIFNDNSKSWPFFYKHIGHSVSNFSAPIFLRNYSCCLFYSDNNCGSLCG